MQYEQQLNELISSALMEDIGSGDHSTLSTININAQGKAVLKIKEDCIIAGIQVAKAVFQFLEKDVRFTPVIKDGDIVKSGDTAFTIEGRIHTILSAERLVLNCMQRMSGIATLTHKFVRKLEFKHTKILDTRKTTPNFRLLEKEAVKIGGGTNHRFGLYDMIMLKDNHIDYAGGINRAIEQAIAYNKLNKLQLKIEVEARSLADVKEILKVGGIDRVMLDNFSVDTLREALLLINGKFETEASGGINLENVEAYAETGVDYISSGSVIHQATSVDLSLKAQIL